MSESKSLDPSDNQYIPSKLTCFLWWLSTSEEELIKDSIVDRNRFKIIGTTVLTTWLFATLAWTYFFSTVIQNAFLFILLGVFMGFVILTIDRALIKGISNSQKNKILPLLLRGCLALTIGVFMAQPALLFLFNKEIKLQTMVDNQKRQEEKNNGLTATFKNKVDALNNEKKQYQEQLNNLMVSVDAARVNYLAEADGSGGTGKVGIKMIALAKKAEYEKLADNLTRTKEDLEPKINQIENQLSSIRDHINKEEIAFSNNFNDGFLTRIEALNNLIKTNTALQFRYYLLVTILMLIELMPVIAKMLLPSHLYDEKVRLGEEIEHSLLLQNIENELEVKGYYNSGAKKFDKESIDIFFTAIQQGKTNRIQKYSNELNNDDTQSVDGLWGKMKKDIMTKNEN